MDTRRPPLSLLAAAIVTLSVAACGSSTTVARDGTLRIALSEYRVVPQDVHTTAGILTLVVHNYGRLTHDLVISLGGQPEISSEPIGPGALSAGSRCPEPRTRWGPPRH